MCTEAQNETLILIVPLLVLIKPIADPFVSAQRLSAGS